MVCIRFRCLHYFCTEYLIALLILIPEIYLKQSLKYKVQFHFFDRTGFFIISFLGKANDKIILITITKAMTYKEYSG